MLLALTFIATLIVLLLWLAILAKTLKPLRQLYRISAVASLVLGVMCLATGAILASFGLQGWHSMILANSAASPSWTFWAESLVYSVTGLGILALYRRYDVQEELGRAHSREQQLREKEQTLSHLASSAFEGIYLVDPVAMTYVDSNPSGALALQYEVAEMRGLSLERIHPGETDILSSQFTRVLQTGKEVRFTIDAQRRDGKRILVELSCGRVERDGRSLILALGRDLSRWQKSSRKIEKLNQLYAMLSQSNRAMTRIHDRLELFQRICEIAVQEGGFLTAWMGERQGNRVVPICRAGSNKGYLDKIVITLDDTETGRGPMARSIREGRVMFANDVQNDPLFMPWQQAVMARGIRSVAAIPIKLRNETIGAISFYSTQANTFDEQLADLLQSLAEDVSYAITHIDAERERVKAQTQLNKLSRAVEQSADAVMIISTAGLIEYVNPRFTEITGYTSDEVLGREPSLLCASESEARKYSTILEDLKHGRNWKGDFRNRKKSGEVYWSMDTISPIRDDSGAISHFVSTSEDYTDLRKAQDMIEQLAFYDPLTELPNRRLLHDRMRQAIETARRDQTLVAVMFLDLDKFKQVNDSMGHPAGDELLRVIAERLKQSVRSKDTIARLGGDEFTIVLTGITQLSDAVLIAEKVLDQIQQPIKLETQSLSITTSIGITLFPNDGDDINDLLRNADLAMYHAKSSGRNNFQFYTEDINQRALGQLELERQLRSAIERESFVLHYQPQLDLSTGEIVAVEALVRWINDDNEVVSPAVFIPLAEETGLIEPIGEWVLKRALQDVKALIDAIDRPLRVAVNLSAYQFRNAGRLKQLIRQVISDSQVDPSLLELELTESMLVDDVQSTIETLHDLRALGISLAIDDFGTGYSSLNYLKQFPIDILKIDRGFVRDIQSSPSDAAITAAIVALGHELNMKILAEGVENEAQLNFLRQHHCDYYQGYFFSPPVPAEALLEMIRKDHPDGGQNLRSGIS